jgi:hypothetical protein
MISAKFSDPWYAKQGVVYFIAAGRPPVAIKIGVTQRFKVANRLRAIQGSNHEPIDLLGVICFELGDKPLFEAERREAALHRQFAHLQRFEHGWCGFEWFTSAPELLEFIAANAVPPQTVDLPRSVCRPIIRGRQ